MAYVSPQRPQEIVLPTMPEFQDAAVSSKCFSQFCPPVNIAELRASPPLRGSLKQLVRPFSCRFSTSGHQVSSSKHNRDQSQEIGSLSRLFSSIETTAKCISLGPADCRKRLSHSVRCTAIAFQRVFSHISEPRAGSGIRTRGEHSLEEGDHRGGSGSSACTSLFQRRMGIVSDFRSATFEPLIHASDVQNAHGQTGRVSDQVRGLVCHDRSKICLLPYIHPSQSQEVPEVRIQGKNLPISGSSLWLITLTQYFHKVCGCCAGFSATPGHPHTQLHRRLVDFSSFRADGSSTSKCHSRSYERIGVKIKRQKSVLSP